MAEFAVFGIDFGWDVFLANAVGVILALWLAKRITLKFDEQAVQLGKMNEPAKVAGDLKAIVSTMDNGLTESLQKRVDAEEAWKQSQLERAQDFNNAGMTSVVNTFPRMVNQVDDIGDTLAQQQDTLQRVGAAYGELAAASKVIDEVKTLADHAAHSAANNAQQLTDMATRAHGFESQVAAGMKALEVTLSNLNLKVDAIREDI